MCFLVARVIRKYGTQGLRVYHYKHIEFSIPKESQLAHLNFFKYASFWNIRCIINLSRCFHIFPCVFKWLYGHILQVTPHRYHGIYILFTLLLWDLWWVQIIVYIMALRSYSFVCNYVIPWSSFCRIVWLQWTYKIIVPSSVSKIKFVIKIIVM